MKAKYDIVVNISCKLNPIEKETTIDEIKRNDDETRINYYLYKLAEKIEEHLSNGGKINMISSLNH